MDQRSKIEDFTEQHGDKSNYAENYRRLWELYDYIYILSIFTYILLISTILIKITPGSGKSSGVFIISLVNQTGNVLIVVGIIVSTAITLILHILYWHGKELNFNTIDLLCYELVIAIRSYEEDNTQRLIRQLRKFIKTARNNPLLYPILPVPAHSSPIYHEVITAIEEYVVAIENAKHCRQSIEKTFEEFVIILIPVLNQKQGTDISEIKDSINIEETTPRSHRRILTDSILDVVFDNQRLVLMAAMILIVSLGVASFLYIGEEFAMQITLILLTILQIMNPRQIKRS